MSIGIAKLECPYAAVFLRERLGTTIGNRLEPDCSEARVGSVHVGNDDGEMLKP